MDNKLTVSLSPHIHGGNSVDRCMWNVVIALMPALGVAVWTFGLPALYVTLVSVVACLLTEWFITRFMLHRPSTLADGSAVVTGVLLAFNVPSILPLWMVVIGAVVAIGIAKMSFGGLGCNIWNPALAARVFLLISFPAAMTTWPSDVESGLAPVADTLSGASAADVSSGATILVSLNNGSISSLSDANMLDVAVGNMNGSLGEVGAIAILVGLGYLMLMRIVTWHIPVAVIGSAAFFSWIFGGVPLLDVLVGGLLLGACFMATDYATSPMTRKGQLIYGVMIGLITIIIRRFGAYPEGVSFAILLMNSFTPLINRYCRPAIFGAAKSRKERRAAV